jgi:hypothetical protein
LNKLVETSGHLPAQALEGFIKAAFNQAQDLEILA